MANLTDLGQTQSSNATRLDEYLGQISPIEQQLAKAKATPPPTTGERLASPTGAMQGIAALVSLLAGQPELAGGIAMGSIGGAHDTAQQQAALHREELDKLETRLQKQQQMITQLLTTDENLFVNAKGENIIDPEALGKLAVGVRIPINPSGAIAAKRMGKQREGRVQVWTDVLKNAPTPDIKQQAMRRLNYELDLGLDDDQLTRLSTVEGLTPQTAAQYFEGSSVLAALQLAFTKYQGDLTNPNVLAMFRPKPDPGGTEAKMNGAVLGLLDDLSQFRRDNPQYAATGPGELAAIAFSNQPEKLGLLRSKLSGFGDTGVNAELIAKSLEVVNRNRLELKALGIDLTSGKTPEQINAEMAEEVVGIAKASADAARVEQATTHAAQINNVVEALSADNSLTPEEAHAVAVQLFVQAYTASGGSLTDTTKKVDSVKLKKALDVSVATYLAGMKGQ